MYCAVTASWCASPERTAYFGVMPNGHTTQLTFPRQEVFDVGDVLLVGTDFYRKVPHDVWPLKPVCPVNLGIVRRALNEGVVLETSDGLGPDGARRAAPAFERESSVVPVGTTGHVVSGSPRKGAERTTLGGGVNHAPQAGVLFAHRIHAGEDFFGAEHVGGHHAVIDIGLGHARCLESMPAAASFTICC